MNKQIAGSFLAIIAVSLATFAVTGAYFTSKATTKGSRFTVGTLDLEVGGANGSNVEPFVIDNIGDNGVSSGSKTWIVTNKGSLTGQLFFKLNNVKNMENGCNPPEALVDQTCDNPGEGQGELGKLIKVKVFLDNSLVAESSLDELNKDAISKIWSEMTPVIMASGKTVAVKMEWGLAPDEYGNEIQSDSLAFDADFDLVQTTGN